MSFTNFRGLGILSAYFIIGLGRCTWGGRQELIRPVREGLDAGRRPGRRNSGSSGRTLPPESAGRCGAAQLRGPLQSPDIRADQSSTAGESTAPSADSLGFGRAVGDSVGEQSQRRDSRRPVHYRVDVHGVIAGVLAAVRVVDRVMVRVSRFF